MVKVKICGNTNPDDAVYAKECGADFLGLIFTESKRKVTVDQAGEIIARVPNFDNFVGVFANQPKETVQTIVRGLNLKWVQFHGNETSQYCDYFTNQKLHVIKTFRVRDKMSLKRIDEYNVAAYLLDAFSPQELGGTGNAFDWSLIEGKGFVHEKMFLAGGLTIENLERAIQRIRPYAVDVASGVEQEPGKKDPELVRQFIAIAKKKDFKR